MTGQLLGAAALVALLVWLVRRAASARRRHPGRADIDHDELDAAEREVRDLGPRVRDEDGFLGDDWGPGAGGRPHGKPAE